MIDLASIDTIAACNKGAEIELEHPVTRAPLGQFLTILGKDSDRFNVKVAELADGANRKAEDARRRGRDVPLKTVRETKAEAIEIIASCVIGFRNITFEGKELPFSHENTLKLFERLPWVREQVDMAFGNLANFIKS